MTEQPYFDDSGEPSGARGRFIRPADDVAPLELIPGLHAVNAGPLETARIVEQLTPLLISVNVRYKTHAGIKLTGLPEGDHWA